MLHRLKGSTHAIPYQNISIATVRLIRSHRLHVKRFCIAHTYSGFCLLTKRSHNLEIGEYFGHQKASTIKLSRNSGSTIDTTKKSFVKYVNSTVVIPTKNIIPAAALILLSLRTGYGASSPLIVRFGIISPISFLYICMLFL